MTTWRVGRHNSRILYQQNGPEPTDTDEMVAMFLREEDARLTVMQHRNNDYRGLCVFIDLYLAGLSTELTRRLNDENYDRRMIAEHADAEIANLLAEINDRMPRDWP